MSLSNFSNYNLVGLASSLSILISKELSLEEIEIFSVFFSALDDNLAIIATTFPSKTNNEINNNN